MADIKKIYRDRIKECLETSGGKSVSVKHLNAQCRVKTKNREIFEEVLSEMEREGVLFRDKDGLRYCFGSEIFRAEVVKLSKTFGFIRDEQGQDFFVPGRFLMGAMPGDIVMAREIPRRGEGPEAEVVSIAEEKFSQFTGTAEMDGASMCVRPDTISRELMAVYQIDVPVKPGDKVLAVVDERGARHSDHKVRITGIFGSSDKAKAGADAILYINGVETEFPEEVLAEAKAAEERGIPEDEVYKRLDLRDMAIFTIDGADTKDIDDAVSLSREGDGWSLGVHIADVSYYVRPGSELDMCALERGTSIYYANKVIPMLPKELSNGICSLNPREDRLAFSCLMKLDGEGKLTSYKFSKSVIRSRVKGVYSEVNSILDCLKSGKEVPSELAEKYDGLTETILLMDELAAVLTANKIRRGAPQLVTSEGKFIIDENDVCIDVKRREQGRSELIIEEFMLMANTAAARLARESGIPFVYRVHEDPSPERVEELMKTVSLMGIQVPKFEKVKPTHLAEILEKTKDTPMAAVINNMTLRAMAKAKYSDEPLGHFGLALADYSHFTSPIRRYPDLAIHRILTDLCYNKKPAEFMNKRYAAFAKEASERSSEREIIAMRVERACDDCYAAEYMTQHLGETFEGTISGVQEFGFFVELPNTVEGLVRLDSLTDGPYEYDGRFALTRYGKAVYQVGGPVKVVCAAANVNSGQVDFVVAEN